MILHYAETQDKPQRVVRNINAIDYACDLVNLWTDAGTTHYVMRFTHAAREADFVRKMELCDDGVW